MPDDHRTGSGAQTVWTALDQRNSIGAPQFGQAPARSVMTARGPLDDAGRHVNRVVAPSISARMRRRVQVGAGAAAEHVDADRAELRERVAGEVRFGQHHEAGHAAGSGKDVPGRIADRRQLQFGDQPIEERTQERQIRESGGVAAMGVDDPLDAAHGTAVYRPASPALCRFSLYPAVMNRREVIAALASAAGMPLAYGCTGDAPPADSGADHEADALALLDRIADNLLRLSPESATSLGIDTGARAALRSQLADRSAEGQQRIASQVRADLARVSAFDTGAALARDAHQRRGRAQRLCDIAFEGFALPYGDITVGGWRNTPYVVIQNVGAYLDVPRFLDSDHPIENAADAEAYLARLQSYAKQLDGELGRMQAARGDGPGAAGVPDRQGAGADAAVGEERARRRRARRVDRAADEEHPRQLGRARARRSPRRRSRRRSSGRSPSCRRSARVATNDAGMWARPHGEEFYRWALKASTTTEHVAGRGPRDGPERAEAAARARWTRS